MIIINKKYANLLQGYKRAIDLNNQINNEWKESIKPRIYDLLCDGVNRAAQEYLEKYSKWQDEENAAQMEWDNLERKKQTNWELNESKIELKVVNENDKIRKVNSSATFSQNTLRVISLCLLSVGLGGIVMLSTTYIPFQNPITIIFVNIFLLLFSIVSVLVGIILFGVSFINNKVDFIQYQPGEKYNPIPYMESAPPEEPATPEDLIGNLEPPNILQLWFDRIQYHRNGIEYFDDLMQKHPESAGGIPGELAMMEKIQMETLRDFMGIENDEIYIPGLMIGPHNDIDGILILWDGFIVLESKYLTGEIIYKSGKWTHMIIKKDKYGIEASRHEKKYQKSLLIDKQVEFAKKIVLSKLKDKLLKNNLLNEMIYERIVFTHPNLEVSIEGCPVKWMRLNDVFGLISSLDCKYAITMEDKLEIADFLLESSRRFEPEEISAIDLADQIFDEIMQQYDYEIDELSQNPLSSYQIQCIEQFESSYDPEDIYF